MTYLKKGYPMGREQRLLPDHIDKWLKDNHKTEMRKGAQKLATWLKQMPNPLRIQNGTAIGKHYDTLILDITYQGSEFSVNEFGDVKWHNTNKDINGRKDLKEILNPQIRI